MPRVGWSRRSLLGAAILLLAPLVAGPALLRLQSTLSGARSSDIGVVFDGYFCCDLGAATGSCDQVTAGDSLEAQEQCPSAEGKELFVDSAQCAAACAPPPASSEAASSSSEPSYYCCHAWENYSPTNPDLRSGVCHEYPVSQLSAQTCPPSPTFVTSHQFDPGYPNDTYIADTPGQCQQFCPGGAGWACPAGFTDPQVAGVV